MPAHAVAPEPTPLTRESFPTPVVGATVLRTRKGNTTPSLFIDEATRSLELSTVDMSSSWIVFQNVTVEGIQRLRGEMTKAARQLECNLSQHRTDSADGSITVAYRFQPKRPKVEATA
jgi:hypothetical protein